ncbi:GNAT family N-acetyltransferase [Clavibacter zhangzhiyongii]|uniref:GNAT family N-acetyltransferase n=1 Tax=Clavibacter zhangzhiyongii TaxID=2768071 RepID=UPI0039E0458D
MRPPGGLTEIVDDHRDEAVRDIATALSTWFPASTHPGGFAWEASTGQLPERIAVVRDDAGVPIGWAAFSPDDARVECAPGDDAATDLLAGWLLDAAGDGRTSVAVHRGQDRLRRILAGRGFVDEAVPLAGLRHAARDTGARPPAGYRIRPVAEGEEQAKVDAHRRAWKPVELPFTDGSGEGIDPAAESRFDAVGYAAMQTAAVYRRDLDLVIEAPDGSLAGTCTAWLDPATGWAELEPLGVVPAHRRRGLAQTLALDVCRRVGELGGRDVFINASPLPYYRAPWDAYVAAGFTPMERGTRMHRPA